MKKIAFLVPSLGMGGMERVLVNYANLFNRRGYEVTVYNMTSGEEAITKHFDSNVKYYSNYNPVKHILRANFKEIVTGKFRVLPFGKWISWHSDKYLHKKYFKKNFDVEVAFFGITSIKIVNGCTNENTKTIAWIHGEQKHNDFAPINNVENAIEIFSKTDKMICVSERAKNTVDSVYKRNHDLYVVNNPNDTKNIRLLAENKDDIPEKKKFTFVNASRFDDKQKGYSRFLKECRKLVDDGSDFDVWLVGGGIDYDKIVSLANEYKLTNIKFLGQQSNPYKYIKNADMYVCFSYSEGFSMVMIETVILATPILSTNVPGAEEMLGDNKYGLIVENSGSGIYEGMKKIMSDTKLYEHYKNMAEERKDYLKEEKIMDEVELILNK